ncbi:MAG: hypothetical protein J6V09_02440 [Clostridia bacterium]|nr:hypothetical protein [Clostridia bacterium]
MRRVKGANILRSKTASVALGVAISLLSLILCGAVCALVLTFMDIPIKHVSLTAMIALILSGALSAPIILHTAKEGGRVRVLICATITSLIIIASSLIASGGKVSGRIFMNIACYIMISVFFAFIKLNGARRKRRR